MAFAISARGTDGVLLPAWILQNQDRSDPGTRFVLTNGRFHAYYANDGVRLRIQETTIQLRFAGANPKARVDALPPVPGRINLLKGKDPAQWATDLEAYSGVIYRNLYPGIDMIWRAHGASVKTEFLVAPGARVNVIRMRYTGAKDVHIDESGALVLGDGASQIRDEAPEAYAERDGVRKRVGAGYRLGAGGVVGFHVDPYDRRATLIVDPVLSYSTLLSGSDHDSATSVAVDANGNAYVAGWTESLDFPVTGGLPRGSGIDMFVAKFTPTNALAWCTFIGGSGDDRAFAIAVDISGRPVIAGSTTSIDMPLVNPLQATSGGGSDVFVARLNATGTALVFSTYFGGSATDAACAVAFDAAGGIYVAGNTTSKDFPTLNAFQSTNNGQQNGFVFKLNATATALVYSTLLGGSSLDSISGIAIDQYRAAYVAGSTQSTNFPLQNAFQATNHGQETAFVTKLDPTGRSLVYSSLLGGSGGTWLTPEMGTAIAVDATGAAYVAGVTSSADFPVNNAYQSTYGGGVDAFVAKINPAGSAITYSTYFGGSSRDWATGIAVDWSGSVYFCGYTSSDDFPILQAVQNSNAGIYDAFTTHLDTSGTLVSSTYLGGSAIDMANGITIDTAGDIFVAGYTMSSNFPLVSPLYSANKDNYSAFFAKLSGLSPGCTYSVSPNPVVLPASGGTFALSMNTSANCTWGAGTNTPWLHVGTVSGAGAGTITVSADANYATSVRSGSISAGGQTVTVNQTVSSCSFVLSVANAFVGAETGLGSITATTTPGCLWTASTATGWIALRNGPNYSGSGSVSFVYLANATGVARVGALTIAGQNVTVTQSPFRSLTWPPLAATDYNSDGMSDLLVYNPTNGYGYELLSSGDGHYKSVINTVGAGYDTVRSGDFNGDLIADAFFYNRTTGDARLGYSNGAGNLTLTPVTLLPGYDFVIQGDFNWDGKTDLLLYNSSNGYTTVALSNGAGGFSFVNAYYSPAVTSVIVADFNGDGKADVLFYNGAIGQAYIGFGDGMGGFTFQPLFLGSGYDYLIAGDLNSDGWPDLILYRSKDGTCYFGINDGRGNFTFKFQFWSRNFSTVLLADFNGDGIADLALYRKSDATGYLLLGDGTGNFTSTSLFWGPGFDTILARDIDGNYKQDVVFYRNADGTCYTGISNGTGFHYVYSLFGTGRLLAQ